MTSGIRTLGWAPYHRLFIVSRAHQSCSPDHIFSILVQPGTDFSDSYFTCNLSPLSSLLKKLCCVDKSLYPLPQKLKALRCLDFTVISLDRLLCGR